MKKLVIVSIVAVMFCLLTVGAKATIYDIDKDPEFVLYGNLGQNDPALIAAMGVPLAGVACGPVAVTNSYRYLERKYVGTYGVDGLTGGDLVGTAVNLAALMGTTPPGGTFADDLIWYKKQYIESKVPGKTIYEAQYWPTWGWSIWDDAAVVQPDWVHSVVPTWNWLWDQLVACEDVEILMTYRYEDGGHFVTLKSFHWDDVNNDGFIQASEGATIDFVDSATGLVVVASLDDEGTMGGLPCMQVGYGGGAWITMAVKESIPEPATMLILALGGLLLRRRKA